jgi:hypothetical protein
MKFAVSTYVAPAGRLASRAALNAFVNCEA